jgi:hypothetical protein
MPNPSMPMGSFRRPELRMAAEIDYRIKQIPLRYSSRIPGATNVEKYMSLQLACDEPRGTTVAHIKDMLRSQPFRFDLKNLSVKDKSDLYRVSKSFNSVDVHKFFRISGYSLMVGINCLIRLIDAKDKTIRVLADLDAEVQEILKAREEFALEMVSKYSIGGYKHEQVCYIFGPTNQFELSELFFEVPSSFASGSHCTKCEREITNWISVILGEGPICGEHKYEISILGKSLREISDQIIDLVDRKYSLLANGPLSIKSPLVEFRKSRLDYLGGPDLAGGDLYLDQTPFWRPSILRDIQLQDQPRDSWKEYIFGRVLSEYKPHRRSEDFNSED